jgi:hypothetical protein
VLATSYLKHASEADKLQSHCCVRQFHYSVTSSKLCLQRLYTAATTTATPVQEAFWDFASPRFTDKKIDLSDTAFDKAATEFCEDIEKMVESFKNKVK